MTILRRAVIAAIPALTISAGAMANIRQSGKSDAELLARCDAFIEACRNVHATFEAWQTRKYEIEDETGCPSYDKPGSVRGATAREEMRKCMEEGGANRLYDVFCDACDHHRSVMAQIFERPAYTPEGIAAKVRILRNAMGHETAESVGPYGHVFEPYDFKLAWFETVADDILRLGGVK